MKIARAYLVVSIILIMSIGLGLYYFIINTKQNTAPFTTYFTYTSQELSPLKNLSSSNVITLDNLTLIDQLAYQLVRENKMGDAYAARMFAYLYTAQRDMASLSFQLTGHFSGSVDELSAKILCLFFANECSATGKLRDLINIDDEFSEKLSHIVYNKYKLRWDKDQAGTHPIVSKQDALSWAGTKPYYAMEVGSWLPWKLSNIDQFTAPPPPSSTDNTFWQQQLTLTNITQDQTTKVVNWAGVPGTLTPPGMWLQIANDYMAEKNIPLEKQMLVKSVLAMGLTDACIAVFHSKYLYLVKRPNMLDTTIITIMPTPNHPSYPAAHATISAAAAVILTYYFPSNIEDWNNLAHEAGESRIWGGIHFPVDNKFGFKLGQSVGQAAVNESKQ